MSQSTHDSKQAVLVHHVKGRTRLRFPGCRGSGEQLEQLASSLESEEKVEAVTRNPTTTSLVVYHQIGDAEQLLSWAADRGLFTCRVAKPQRSLSEWLGDELWSRVASTERWLARESRGTVDLTGLTALVLLSATVYQAGRGKMLPAGFTLLKSVVGLIPGSGDRDG